MLFLTLPIRVSPQFSSQFHSPLSTKRRRVPSSGIFEWKCFRDCGTFPKSQHGPGIWNTRMKRKMVVYKNYLSTNTLGIWTSCRGLFPSFRAWLRFKILKKNHDTVVNRILLSINQQFLFSSYECKFHLTPHDTHLLFKHQPVKTFVCLKKKQWSFKMIVQTDFVNIIFTDLEECVKVIADILDKVHVTQLVQHQVPCLMGERHLTKDHCTMTFNVILHTTTLLNNLGSR